MAWAQDRWASRSRKVVGYWTIKKKKKKILGIYIFSLVSFIFGGSTTKSEIKNIEVRGENITKYYGD